MRIALTGASGILGEALSERATLVGHTIVPVSREQLLGGLACLRVVAADADVMIHAAANTNVEACELDPVVCYRDNLLVSEQVAEACQLEMRKMVFISSTGVYGQRKEEPYAEYDAVEPPTHHHRAKRLAEKSVLAFSRRNLVLRTGWLFGGSSKKPKNFVARRLEEAAAAMEEGRTEIPANSLQRGTPSYTGDIADRLFEALDRDETGLFNAVNTGHASRLVYVQAILDAAGFPLRAVPAVGDSSFKRIAQVSNNESAVNWRFEALGYPPMPNWQISLNEYVIALCAKG